MSSTFNFGVTHWTEGYTQPWNLFNDLANKFDVWTGAVVASRTTDAEPGSPTEGDAYIITGSATGTNWSTFAANSLALYTDGSWVEYPPAGAVTVRVTDESSARYYWTGSAWTAESGLVSTDINTLAKLNAIVADATLMDEDDVDPIGKKKSNLAATAAPTVDNDTTESYEVGSVWIDTTNDAIYHCLDATDGAAVWQQVGSGGGGGLTPVFIDHTDSPYAVSDGEHVFFDSSGGAITVTSLSTPAGDERFNLTDVGGAAATNNVTVDRNGETMNGLTENVIISQDWAEYKFGYDGTTSDWRVGVNASAATALVVEGIVSGRQETPLPVGMGWGDGTGTPVVVDNATAGQLGASFIDMATGVNTKLFLVIPMPERWDGAEDLTLEVSWMATTTGTGNVAWWLAAGALADGDSVSSGFQNTSQATQAAPASTTVFKIHSDDIANTDPNSAKGDWLSIMIQRRGGDASDTYGGTVRFMGANLKWTSDAVNDDV